MTDSIPSEVTEQNDDGKKFKDRFGFWRSNDFHKSFSIHEDEDRRRKQKDTERIKKWEAMIKDWDRTNYYRASKLKSRVRKGIPDSMRIFAWPRLAGNENFRSKFRALKSIQNLELDEKVIDEVKVVEFYTMQRYFLNFIIPHLDYFPIID